jgi:hypothetical protein
MARSRIAPQVTINGPANPTARYWEVDAAGATNTEDDMTLILFRSHYRRCRIAGDGVIRSVLQAWRYATAPAPF